MKRGVFTLALLFCLAVCPIALAKNSAQYVIKDGVGNLLFEVTVRSDAIIIFDHRTKREYFIQIKSDAPDTLILFDADKIYYQMEPYKK